MENITPMYIFFKFFLYESYLYKKIIILCIYKKKKYGDIQ